jgi:hypothetical protein
MVNYRKHTAAAIASAAAAGLASAACGGSTSSSTTVSSACQAPTRRGPTGRMARLRSTRSAPTLASSPLTCQQVASRDEGAGLVTVTFNAGGKLGVDSYHALQNPPPSACEGSRGHTALH